MPRTPTNKRHRAVIKLATLLLFVLTAASFSGAQPSAQVGTIQPDGSIVLDKWKFKPEISNGLPVFDITTEISNGLLSVVLQAKDGCHAVHLSLLDSTGTPIEESAPSLSGGIFVQEDRSTALVSNCEDDGCEEFATQPWIEAKCRRLYPWPCTCVVTTSGDQVHIEGPEFCKRPFANLVQWSLSDYIWFQFINP